VTFAAICVKKRKLKQMISILDNMARAGKINPPQFVANTFEILFPQAINVEWYVNTLGFEAVFHHNQREMIAMLSANGELLETRHNLPATEAPAMVTTALTPGVELMNVIRVEKNAGVTFEIIYRNQNLDRFIMLIDEQGNINSDSPL
jgi:hypothetical protein